MSYALRLICCLDCILHIGLTREPLQPGLTSSTLFIYVSTIIFDENTAQNSDENMTQKFWRKHGSNFRSTFLSENSNFDPCFRWKIQTSTHVSVEASTMLDLIDIKYPCFRRLWRWTSMLRRHSTLFIRGLMWKCLKTYVEIPSNSATLEISARGKRISSWLGFLLFPLWKNSSKFSFFMCWNQLILR